MKRRILSSFIVIFLFIIFFGSRNKLFSAVDDSRATADGVSGLVEVNNQFAFKLYSAYKEKKGNIFFSPYSIITAIGMTYEGARGKTAEEMEKVFHFAQPGVLRSSFAKIYNQINKPDKKYKLSTANALWAAVNYPFLKEYFSVIEKYYGGTVTNLDFEKDPEPSRLTINKWVEEQTDNKIIGLIDPGLINENTRLILTNAIYFKAKWLRQFDKQSTREQSFRSSAGNSVKAQMMSFMADEEWFNYAEDEKMQILELPYESKELSMLIFLPKGDDLNSLDEVFNTGKFVELRNSLRRQSVKVYLPKFKFDSKYDLSDKLIEIGMQAAFSEKKADFSGMTEMKRLFISKVIHQSFVEVNEEGTEAAATTAVLMRDNAMRVNKVFNANHTFVFIILEKETGNILFLGRVAEPQG